MMATPQNGIQKGEANDAGDRSTILLTGGTGGIGYHLVEKLRKKYDILKVSRNAEAGEVKGVQNVQLDLTDEKAYDIIPERKILWIVHLATTYNVKKDMAIVQNLLKFAHSRGIPNFCFFSSWVVSFPRRLVREPYLRMKGQCEQLIRDYCEKSAKHFLIVRPSVVIGENLSWSRTLNRLWYVRHLIPRNMYRCWISIDQVTAAVETHFKAVAEKRTTSKTIQLLGERETLYQATHSRTLNREHWQPVPDPVAVALLWIIAPLTFAFRMIMYMILVVVSWFSTYLNSFYIRHFKPTTQEEILTFFNGYNNCLISGSENMLLWHYTPPWIIEQKKILVTTRGLNNIHEINDDVVVCDAGVTIAELLKALKKKNLTITTYPNYHDITVGACVAGPVHGHSHKFATVAALITKIKLFDIDQQKIFMMEKGTEEFQDLMFNTSSNNIVVLEITLKHCPLDEFVKTRKRLSFLGTSPEVLIKHAKFGDSCEIRMYVPMLDAFLGPAHSILQYTPMIKGLMLTATVWNKKITKSGAHAGDMGEESKTNGTSFEKGEVEKVKGDINWKRYVERSTKFLWSLGSKCIMNTEWFFTEEQFITFWKYYQKNWWKLGFYKILIRHCKADDFPHSPCYNTNVYAIDIIAARYQRPFLAELMPKFAKTMHASKFLCTDPYATGKQAL